jgi:hypothetical protein
MANPSKPAGVATERITKTGGYSTAEQEVPRSVPSPSNTERGRAWASPSYDPHNGRPTRVGKDGAADMKQIPRAGEHTVTQNNKARTRPGRW